MWSKDGGNPLHYLIGRSRGSKDGGNPFKQIVALSNISVKN